MVTQKATDRTLIDHHILPPSSSPSCGGDPLFRQSATVDSWASARGRRGEHPEQHLVDYAGLMQADAYAGLGKALWDQSQGTASAPHALRPFTLA